MAVDAGQQGGSLRFDREVDSAVVKGLYQLGAKELLRLSLLQFYRDHAPEKVQVQSVLKFSLGSFSDSLGRGQPSSGVTCKTSVAVDVEKVAEACVLQYVDACAYLSTVSAALPLCALRTPTT